MIAVWESDISDTFLIPRYETCHEMSVEKISLKMIEYYRNNECKNKGEIDSLRPRKCGVWGFTQAELFVRGTQRIGKLSVLKIFNPL